MCWLPGGRILITTTGQTSQNSNSRWAGQVEEIDALSGRHTVLEGLTAVFNRYSSHFDHDGPLYPGASSDGQWLLWHRRDPATGHTHHVTVKMDGSGYHEWNDNADEGSSWANGHRWFIRTQRLAKNVIICRDAEDYHFEQRFPYESAAAYAIEHGNDTGSYLHATFPGQSELYKFLPDSLDMPPGVRSISWPVVEFPHTLAAYKVTNGPRSAVALVLNQAIVPRYSRLQQWVRGGLLPAYKNFDTVYLFNTSSKAFQKVCSFDDDQQESSVRHRMTWSNDGRLFEFEHNHNLYVLDSQGGFGYSALRNPAVQVGSL